MVDKNKGKATNFYHLNIERKKRVKKSVAKQSRVNYYFVH